MILILKFLLRLRRVCRNSQNYRPGVLQFFIRVAEPARFNGSTGSIGFGKEEQHHRLAAKVLQRDVFPVLVRQTELRSFIISIHGDICLSPIVIPYLPPNRHLDGGSAPWADESPCPIQPSTSS